MNPVSLKAFDAVLPSPPALLYHGTTARSVLKILEQGLRPRGRRKGNYANALSSDNRNVYLTTIYGPAYACRSRPRWSEMLAVVEIDFTYLDTSFLRPDEDFLAQSILPFHLPADAASRLAVHEAVRRRGDDFQEMWGASLDGLGTVAYQGIVPPEAVTRVAVFDPKLVPEMVFAMGDTTITVMEHRTCGPQIAAWTRWLFDGPAAVRMSDFDPMMKFIEDIDDSEMPTVMREFARLQEERLRPFLDRWDVEVRINPSYGGWGSYAEAKGSHAEAKGSHAETASAP